MLYLSTRYWVLFASFLSGRATTTQMDCLAPMEICVKWFFPKTQHRIASFETEPGTSNLSITSLMHKSSYRHGIWNSDILANQLNQNNERFKSRTLTLPI